MNRKERRKDQTRIGKSFWRKINRHNLPEEGKSIKFWTKYGIEHIGFYKNSKYFTTILGTKKLMPFGKNEISKWEYYNSIENNPSCDINK